MKEHILDAGWETPKQNSTNIIKATIGIITLNFFMYFFVMPFEQTSANSHSASPVSIILISIMIVCFIVGITNLLKKKSNYSIAYLSLSFNLIFWLYILAQINCTQCSQA